MHVKFRKTWRKDVVLHNLIEISYLLAFTKLEATKVATEISYYAARRLENDVHKLKLRNVVLCLHLAT